MSPLAPASSGVAVMASATRRDRHERPRPDRRIDQSAVAVAVHAAACALAHAPVRHVHDPPGACSLTRCQAPNRPFRPGPSASLPQSAPVQCKSIHSPPCRPGRAPPAIRFCSGDNDRNAPTGYGPQARISPPSSSSARSRAASCRLAVVSAAGGPRVFA